MIRSHFAVFDVAALINDAIAGFFQADDAEDCVNRGSQYQCADDQRRLDQHAHVVLADLRRSATRTPAGLKYLSGFGGIRLSSGRVG